MRHQIVLFHSALGLKPAVLRWAEAWRADGHTVHTPDLFDGEVFATVEDGIRKRDTLGIPEVIRRAQAALASLPGDSVVAGFSLGAGAAEFLALTHPGVKAAVLMHGAFAPAELGAQAWPRTVPVQVHYARHDPWVAVNGVAALAEAVRHAGASAEVFEYPGGKHLFADSDAPDYDASAAVLMWERVRAFLASV